VIDSTPLERGRSRPTARPSDLAGFAGYGYCANHSRYCWGLRCHLVCTPSCLPVTFALVNPKVDEREVARDHFEFDSDLRSQRPGQVIVADKGYVSTEFEGFFGARGAQLIRPARKGEAPRPGARFLKPLRQLIESVNNTLKSRLDLERQGGHAPRCRDPGAATTARSGYCHLAQPPQSTTHPAIPHRP
jgi:hypothetical protein